MRRFEEDEEVESWKTAGMAKKKDKAEKKARRAIDTACSFAG
jgi:hypothetical protein